MYDWHVCVKFVVLNIFFFVFFLQLVLLFLLVTNLFEADRQRWQLEELCCLEMRVHRRAWPLFPMNYLGLALFDLFMDVLSLLDCGWQVTQTEDLIFDFCYWPIVLSLWRGTTYWTEIISKWVLYHKLCLTKVRPLILHLMWEERVMLVRWHSWRMKRAYLHGLRLIYLRLSTPCAQGQNFLFPGLLVEFPNTRH